jgi:transposase
MRPYGTPKALERRRRKAISLLKSGFSLAEVAQRVNTSFTSVYRWHQAFKKKGDKALAPKPVSGRPRKLKEKEINILLDILLEGALAYGFPNDLWTLKRIARVIRKEFGIKYHQSHIWKILRDFGWSCQVPERRALQRDEDAIVHWKRYKWPAIKKTRKTWCPPRIPR